MPSILALTTLAATAAVATAQTTSGCGTSHVAGYNEHSIVSGGINRTYGIYVPSSYNNNVNQARSTILDFHGHGATSKEQYLNSRYYNNTQGKEYLVAYPQGTTGTDGSSAWEGAPYADKSVDDVAFTKDLLQHLRENYCVDSTRVYASGKSNGGGFVDYLACSDEGDEFAAFGMASAALYSDDSLSTCSKKRAILESHGNKDQIIKPTGGNSHNANYPDIFTWEEWWAQRDGCSASTQPTVTSFDSYNLTSYSCGGFTNIVNHYQVYDLGHCWPALSPNNDSSGANCDVYVLDFTQKVVDFFARFTSKNKP